MTPFRPSFAVAACAGAMILAACGSSPAAQSADPSTASPSPTRTATPKPVTSLLSGRPAKDGRVVAVKVDNARRALPHVGLREADVVYAQQVEGGISRLAALYSTQLPPAVVPVRSARETDAQLLPMFGEIPVAFSGSVATVHTRLTQAGLRDVSADRGPKGYSRVSGRPAPHDLAVDPRAMLERAEGSPKARDVGFRFGSAPPGGRKASSITATMPAATLSFRYVPSSGRWEYSLDGRVDRVPGQPAVAPSTVIVQSVPVRMLERKDSSGANVPLTTTVGRGKAVVLRDGKSYNVTWSRKSDDAPTRWTYKGKDFRMKAGQMWIVLLDQRRSPTIR